METKPLKLETALEHSDLFDPAVVWHKITQHFKWAHWEIPGRVNRIIGTDEIARVKPKLRYLRHEFKESGELIIETNYGQLKFFNDESK